MFLLTHQGGSRGIPAEAPEHNPRNHRHVTQARAPRSWRREPPRGADNLPDGKEREVWKCDAAETWSDTICDILYQTEGTWSEEGAPKNGGLAA